MSGYHKCIGGGLSALRGYHKCIGGYRDLCGDITSTLGVLHNITDMM